LGLHKETQQYPPLITHLLQSKNPVSVHIISLNHYKALLERSHLKTLPCICLRYLTQPLLGISRAIAPEKLTLYLFTLLSHSTITGD